ncbi:hypothetical protein DWF00_04310 [Bosea caraganae]|uniref:Tetratricopeptide repeat protein n=1 Tax=Bosea caraganae TaxID=2763117 RepID=A0A370KXW6_9HYPH|nr:hypothetical protein [Bosea caraganae]RDJ19823.1 hypothetical protein DWE98_27810 [Bosea caraganae]RDJ30036.1 hypothetical protein DWF00_04310 [Bosea caraganae]
MMADPAPLDDDAKRAALEHLLSQPGFRASPRNRDFLRFVVEETLAGRSDRIKAYTIAVDVFGRRADFDGMLDPVVRIEAGRLRQALANYYIGEGHLDRVRIGLPRGGYAPAFEAIGMAPPAAGAAAPIATAREPAETPAEPAPPVQAKAVRRDPLSRITAELPRRPWWLAGLAAAFLALLALGLFALDRTRDQVEAQPPLVLVAQVQALSDDSPTTALSRTLSRSLPAAISRFEGLTVIAARPDQSDRDLIAGIFAREPPSRRVYMVTASVKADSRSARAFWRLTDGRNEAILWSGTTDSPFTRNAGVAPEDDIAQTIANAIASRRGVISAFEWKAIPTPPAPGYACVTLARGFATVLTDSLRGEMTACLEGTVAQDPDNAEAWALLGYIYADENRSRSAEPEVAKAALAKAEAAAAKAEALAPYSSLTQETVSVVAFQSGDMQRFEAAGKRAMEMNPENPGRQVVFYNRLFLLGRYDEAIDGLRQAIGRRATPVAMDQIFIIVDLYRRQDYGAALAALEKIQLPNFYLYWLLLAATQGELGNPQPARDAVANLLRLRPNYGAGMRVDFRNRRFEDDLIDRLANGLRKAGLQIK